MKFLIDGSSVRLQERILQWPEGIAGQLLTPLTNYKLASKTFAMDNGCFSGLREDKFLRMLKRNLIYQDQCLFVCVPDKLSDAKETMEMWKRYSHLVDGWPKAFVAQDGYDGMPNEASCLFIGGSTEFKDSLDVKYAIIDARAEGKHIHIGRVNGPDRFNSFDKYADTCDGSGVSKYDHMLIKIRDSVLRQAC